MDLRYVFLPAIALLIGLLVAEKSRKSGFVLTFKTPLSILFVVVALIRPHPLPWYYYCVLAGLILGLVGDVCLALPGNKSFRIGLVSFLLGHVMYVIAFAGLSEGSDWVRSSHLAVLVVSGGVFLWLRPHLGAMMIPVLAYVVVISLMVIAAAAAYHNMFIPRMGAGSILIGAILFYLSDLFVARDRFVKKEYLNRLVGLPLYYAGQFLIALSVSMVD